MNSKEDTSVEYSFDGGGGDASIYRNEEGAKDQMQISTVVKKGAAKPKLFIRNRKRVKLGVGVGSVDGNISLVSLNPVRR